MNIGFIAEPIVNIDEKLLGIELLTRLVSDEKRPLNPEVVISSWDLSNKRTLLNQQCAVIENRLHMEALKVAQIWGLQGCLFKSVPFHQIENLT
jgi:hypothetical protein